MASRRRSRGSRRGSSYLPVVVLNNQQPYLESRSETVNKDQVPSYKKSSKWPGKFSVQDLTFGLLGGSSSPDPMRSPSSLSGSYSGGGCSSGSGGSFDTLLFLAALAAAVFFLNQAIIMNIGRKRRKFSWETQVGLFDAGKRTVKEQLDKNVYVSGIEDFEEKIADWVNATDEDNVASWVDQLVKQFYGNVTYEEYISGDDLGQKKLEASILPK